MAYGKFETITIDHTKVGASDSIDFQYLFIGTFPWLANVIHGGFTYSLNGFDIAFASDDIPTLINWEVEYFNPVTGEIVAWVRIPIISHITDTNLYVFYSDPAITTFQGGAQGSAWPGYESVYHLPDGTTLSGVASAARNGTLTLHGTPAVAGQMDGGAGTGPGNFLHDDTLVGFIVSTTFTFSLWAKTTQVVSAPFATFGRDTGANQCALYLDGASGIAFITNGGNFTVSSVVPVNDGNWHYLLATVDTISGETKFYLDGVLKSTGVILWNISIGTPIDNITIGRLGGGLQPLTASIDEVRVYNDILEPHTITGYFNSQKSPDVFSEVTSPPPVAPVSVNCNGSGVGAVGSFFTHTYTATGGFGAYTWSATGLPDGLSIDPVTGVVSGEPTLGGSYNPDISATDAQLSEGTTACSIQIEQGLDVGCNNPPAGIVGQAYNHQFSISGGVFPYTVGSTGVLPFGLILGSTGALLGVPVVSGTFQFAVTVEDSIGGTDSVNCSVVIVCSDNGGQG